MLTKISTHSYFADDGSVPNYVDAAIFSIPGYSKHSCQRLTFNGSDEETSCASFVQRLSGYNLSDNKIEEGGPVVETCGPDDLVFDQSDGLKSLLFCIFAISGLLRSKLTAFSRLKKNLILILL